MSGIILQAFLLTSAISADCFASGFAYGANKIKVPIFSVFIISFICTAILAVSLLCGTAIGKVIPHAITVAVCAAILMLLGFFKIFGELIKSRIKNKNRFLKVCADPTAADFDDNKILTFKETIAIAIALSLDGLAVGAGAGLTNQSILNYLIIIGFSLVTDVVYLIFGVFVGRRLAQKSKVNLSWLSGLVLIGVAIMKLCL